MSYKKLLKKLIKRTVKSKTITGLIGTLLYYYTRFVGKTTSWSTKGVDTFYKHLKQDGSIIMIGWHGRAMLFPYFWNHKQPLNALVSLHQDGRLIAGFLEKCGLGTIGGSSNGNAFGSARNLMQSLQDNVSIAIIPDGPKGPNMKLGKSPVYFAQKSGKPLFGVTCSIKGSKIVHKSWDQMMIPIPFSKGIYHVIGPYYIPETANDEELENYRLQIEEDLNKATFSADKKMGIEKIIPGTVAKKKKYSHKK